MKRAPIVLSAILTFASFAGACGSAPPPVETPATPTDPAPADQPGGETPPPAEPAQAPAASPSQPLTSTQFLDELKQMGIDPAKSPDLAKLPLDKKKKIMPLLQKALGFEACTGCHVEGDMKAATRNKTISSRMWKEFVGPLRDEKGGPIFCDSCHNGKQKILNRDDKEGVKKFMDDEYEHKLTRADKKENACSSCHGESMEVAIIDKLWKVPAK